tara:strand:+ start:46156 stop:47007 length:852 start_codon:yes stop_codon:yes gene_type:complete
MKKLIFIISFLTVITIHCQQSQLSFMTYNIRYDNPSDGENAWSNRKDKLIEQIKFYDPDVFGIQEGLSHQVSYMKQWMSEYEMIGVGRDDGAEKGEYASLFYNKKRFDVITSNTFWLSLTPTVPSKNWDASLPRICTYAKLMEKATGLTFWVFNAHFDHKGVESRKKSINLIEEKIKEENKDNLPVIFMGDLNVLPESEVIGKLNKFLIDSYDASKKAPFGPVGTFNGFHFDMPVTKRIDYIFVSRMGLIEVQKYAVLTDGVDLKYRSDHLPVYVELEMYQKK